MTMKWQITETPGHIIHESGDHRIIENKITGDCEVISFGESCDMIAIEEGGLGEAKDLCDFYEDMYGEMNDDDFTWLILENDLFPIMD